MAKPIESTPILKGQDAKDFVRLTQEEEQKPNKKTAEFLQGCYLTYLKQKW